MKNNMEFSNQMFTWSLDKSGPPNSSTSGSSSSNEDMSEAELFQMLLGEETKQATLASSDSNEIKSQKTLSSSTSKLDFRPIHEDIPEDDLQTMTVKEKRQLRNKISARNFRNRRKEYISQLEDEITQQKNENVQLKLEVKWLKNKMEKLQKENDKLRLDSMLGGIIQQQIHSPPQLMPPQQQQQQMVTPSFILDSTDFVNSSLLNTDASTATCSSDESTLSSPPNNLFADFPDNWDFVLPNNTNDAYLSHALVPDWNISQVLQKETSHFSTAPTAFQKYPLLAPALMSIVISHTMNMSTKEILAAEKLSPPSLLLPPYTKPNIVMQKDAQAAWNLLEPLKQLEQRSFNEVEKEEEEGQAEEEEEDKKEEATMTKEECSLTAFTQHVRRYVCQLISDYICHNGNQSNSEQNSFFPCRRIQRFRNNISAC